MTSNEITEKLIEFRKKQITLSKHWQRTGNKALLQFITEILPVNLSAERCGVFLVDPEDQSVWIVSGTYVEERALLTSLSGSVVGRVIKSGEALEVKDLESQVGYHDVAGVKTGFVTRNILCIPVYSKNRDKVIGAIQILNKRNAEFVEDDYLLINRFAELVRDNLEEIYERQKLVSILSDVEKHISHLEGLAHRTRQQEQQ